MKAAALEKCNPIECDQLLSWYAMFQRSIIPFLWQYVISDSVIKLQGLRFVFLFV